MLRRADVETDDVADLLDEEGVGGVLEGLVRCGLRPKARQTREMAVCDRPTASALRRVLQWVAALGFSSRVLVMTRSTSSSEIVRGAPGRG